LNGRRDVGITEFLVSFGTHVIETTGYTGVFLLMVAESMVLPVPSEAVMPFAGFLVARGTLSAAGAVGLATLGSVVGSLLSYAIGRFGGRPLVARFGRYVLLSERDLERTDAFFRRRGGATVFVARFVPVVRHLVSIPAGVGQMGLIPFSSLTAAGALLWNSFLAGCGFLLERNWALVADYSGPIDVAILVLLVAGLAYLVVRHLRRGHST